MTQPQVSDAGQEMYDAIAQWHPNDADYRWAGLLFCESVAQSLQKTLDVTRDDPNTGAPGWSSILDLTRCDTEDLPFLAQFVGVVVAPGTPRDIATNLILTQPSAARGRPATLLSAVKATLTGTQYCVLHERDTTPYHASIEVFRNQMPNQAATLAAIAANKPGMIVVDLTIHDNPTYAQVRSSLPSDSYAARQTKFPTYGDVQGYIPQ